MPTLVSGIELLQEIGFYRVVFPLILVSVVTYGLLMKIKLFGDHKGLNATVAIVMGFIVVSAVEAVTFLTLLIQYAAVGGTILLLLIMLFLFGGVEQKTIAEVMKTPLVYGTIITALVITLFIVGSQALPQLGDTGVEGEVPSEAMRTLFHPTVISLLVLFSIFTVTVYMITRGPE